MASQEFGTQDSFIEYKVKEFVQELFNNGFANEKIEHKVLKFLKNYNASKEPQIAKL